MLMKYCFVVLAGSALAAAEQKQCYFPHKNVHALGIPCDPDAQGPVACCEATHTCLSNRLCWDTKTNHIVRGGCTDPDFQDRACPHLCEGDAQGGGVAFLRQCNGRFDEWTCTDNLDVTNCTLPFPVAPGYVKDYRASKVSNVIFARANTTRNDTEPASSAPADKDDVQQAKLQVGLGAGLGVGLPLLLALAISLWFLRRAQRELKQLRGGQLNSGRAASAGAQYGDRHSHKQEDPPTPSIEDSSTGPPTVYPQGQYALPHQPPPVEMHEVVSPRELESEDQMLRPEIDSSAAQVPLSAVQTPARFYAKPARTH
ncbi:hypothetical protein PG995_016124 [Apiospora arundinis]